MNIKTSDLDFSNIKASLKTALMQKEEFADYNFEASGLSNILDVLAYNTHINGLTANLAINESFLSSAQLRSSVVGHAETLGYTPASRTASTATINVTATLQDGPENITIPAGWEFTGDADGVNYVFRTTKSYTATNNDGTYVFTGSDLSPDILIVEGKTKVKTFFVGPKSDSQVYVIPDDTIDTSTMLVEVYDNFNTIDHVVYSNIDNVATITDDSTVYIVNEAANGQYEIFFSDGNILGKTPQAGNKIVVRYISPSADQANGATQFFSPSINGAQLNVSTVVESSGGAEKESIASIKLNAPRAFATQQRLVTAEDYHSLIISNYGKYVEDAVAWGGNENIPPQYGKVFVSLNFKEGLSDVFINTIQSSIKNDLTSNLSIMSIDTEFVNPQYTYLELLTNFNFDPSQTELTPESLEVQVRDTIAAYARRELSTFDSVFRRSNLLSIIDTLSPAILNSKMTVKGQQRIELDEMLTDLLEQSGGSPVELNQEFKVNFPFALSEPDDREHVITTSIFKYNGVNCTIKNKLGSTTLQIFDLTGNVRLSNVGSYNSALGTISILGIKFSSTSEYSGTALKVSALPANQSTLRPLRNYIIDIDNDKSFTKAIIDYQTTRSVL